MKTRAKNLGGSDVEAIVGILDGWSGKLTWDLLIEAVAKRLAFTYTRQALHGHERIRSAFSARKRSPCNLRSDPVFGASPELQIAVDRIARLEAETIRLKSENNQLLEQFVRWAYNAYARGIDCEYLNRALPQVKRGQTTRQLK